MMAFSVAVTEASSRKTSTPASFSAESRKIPSISTLAPSSEKARKCVSSRRRPMTSPPGGGEEDFPGAGEEGAGEEDGGPDGTGEFGGDFDRSDLLGL